MQLPISSFSRGGAAGPAGPALAGPLFPSSRPDYNITCTCHTQSAYLRSIAYADSAMPSVCHPSSGPTIETPHQPRSFSFPKWPFGCYESASSSLNQKRFRASRLQGYLPQCATMVGRITFSMPLLPLFSPNVIS